MEITKGDLIKKAINGEFDVIIHSANCFCTMGGGIAKQIKKELPEAYEVDCNTIQGDLDKLGTCSYAKIKRGNNNFIVVNAYGQYYYSTNKMQTNYVAIKSCMKWVKENFSGKKIGIPKIGAGLGGGNWEKIFKIINEELANEDVTLVLWEKE